MNREDIVRMAKEAGMESFNICVELDDFAKLVAQRTWVGLTVEEIEAIGKPAAEKDGSIQAWGLFALAIEAKLKEKNT
jgi:hypothetical protein